MGFAGHKNLLDFAMNRMPPEERIEFLYLQLFGFQLFVAGGGVARRRFAFLTGFGAFDSDDLSGHKLLFFFCRLFFDFVFLFNFYRADAVHAAQSSEPTLAQSTVAFELGLGFHGEASPGDSVQTSFGDGFFRQFANAIGVFFNAFEGFFPPIRMPFTRLKKPSSGLKKTPMAFAN